MFCNRLRREPAVALPWRLGIKIHGPYRPGTTRPFLRRVSGGEPGVSGSGWLVSECLATA